MTNKKGAPGCGCCGCYDVTADLGVFSWVPVNQGSIYRRYVVYGGGTRNRYRVTYDESGAAIDSEFLSQEQITLEEVQELHPEEVKTTSTFQFGRQDEDTKYVRSTTYEDESPNTKIRVYEQYSYTYRQTHKGWVTLPYEAVEHIRNWDDKVSDLGLESEDDYQPSCLVGPLPFTYPPTDITWHGYSTDFEAPQTIEDYDAYVDAAETTESISSDGRGSDVKSILPDTVDATEYTLFANDDQAYFSGEWSSVYCLTKIHADANIESVADTKRPTEGLLFVRTQPINEVLTVDHKGLQDFTLEQGKVDYAYVQFTPFQVPVNPYDGHIERSASFTCGAAEFVHEEYLYEVNEDDYGRDVREPQPNEGRIHLTVGLKSEAIEDRPWRGEYSHYGSSFYNQSWDAFIQLHEVAWSGLTKDSTNKLNYGRPETNHTYGEYILDRSPVRFEEPQSKPGFVYKSDKPVWAGTYRYQELIDPTTHGGVVSDSDCLLIGKHPATAFPHGIQDWRFDPANSSTGSVTAVAGLGSAEDFTQVEPPLSYNLFSTIEDVAPLIDFEGYNLLNSGWSVFQRNYELDETYIPINETKVHEQFGVYYTGEYTYNSNHGTITVDPDGAYVQGGFVVSACNFNYPDGYFELPCPDRNNACGLTTPESLPTVGSWKIEHDEHFLIDCFEFEYTLHQFQDQLSIDVQVISNNVADDPDMIEVEATFFIQTFNYGFNEPYLQRPVESGDTTAEDATARLRHEASWVLLEDYLNLPAETDPSWFRFADFLPSLDSDNWTTPVDVVPRTFTMVKQSTFEYDISGTPIVEIPAGEFQAPGCERTDGWFDHTRDVPYWTTLVGVQGNTADNFQIAASLSTPGSMGPGSTVDFTPITTTTYDTRDGFFYIGQIGQYPNYKLYPPAKTYHSFGVAPIRAVYRKQIPRADWKLSESHSFTVEDLVGVDAWDIQQSIYDDSEFSVLAFKLKEELTTAEWNDVVNENAFIPTATESVQLSQEVWAEPELSLYSLRPSYSEAPFGESSIYLYFDPDVDDSVESLLDEYISDRAEANNYEDWSVEGLNIAYHATIYHVKPGAKARHGNEDLAIPNYEVLKGELWKTQRIANEEVYLGPINGRRFYVNDFALIDDNGVFGVFGATVTPRGPTRQDFDLEWTYQWDNITTRFEEPLKQFKYGHKYKINWIKDFTLAITESGYVKTLAAAPLDS